MIIIYRGWGLALLGAAIVLFPMLFLATGSFSVPVVAIAALWIWLGRRKFDEETGEDIPAPSVFFIPVWFYGALLTIPALGFVGIEVANGRIVDWNTDASQKASGGTLAVQPSSVDRERPENIAEEQDVDYPAETGVSLPSNEEDSTDGAAPVSGESPKVAATIPPSPASRREEMRPPAAVRPPSRKSRETSRPAEPARVNLHWTRPEGYEISVRHYQIAIELPEGYERVSRETPMAVGTECLAYWGRKWYPVVVKSLHDDGSITVEWTTFGNSTYAVTRETLITRTDDVSDTSQDKEQSAGALASQPSGPRESNGAESESSVEPPAYSSGTRHYEIAIDIPEDHVRVTRQTPLKVGTNCLAYWGNKWNPVEVRALNEDGGVVVFWEGYGTKYAVTRETLIIDQEALANLE